MAQLDRFFVDYSVSVLVDLAVFPQIRVERIVEHHSDRFFSFQIGAFFVAVRLDRLVGSLRFLRIVQTSIRRVSVIGQSGMSRIVELIERRVAVSRRRQPIGNTLHFGERGRRSGIDSRNWEGAIGRELSIRARIQEQ